MNELKWSKISQQESSLQSLTKIERTQSHKLNQNEAKWIIKMDESKSKSLKIIQNLPKWCKIVQSLPK